MSRTIPAAIRAAALASRTNEVTLAFLDIEHDDLLAAIRVVNNPVAVTRGGNAYAPVDFKIVLPVDKDGEIGNASLIVDAVDRSIIIALRSVVTPVSVTVAIALASAPDTTEVEYGTFLWRPITWNKLVASGDLTYDDRLSVLVPADCVTPDNVPGSF